MQHLAETILEGISRALPVTPVALVAGIFGEHESLSEPEIVAAIEERRIAWASRNWLLREKDGASLWNAAREVLLLRHLIEETQGRWRWNPDERLLQSYYANSLLTFEQVKQRGWRDWSDREGVRADYKTAAV